MSILSLLIQNLGHGSRTRKPQDEVAYPADYRGALAHDASLCVGCRTCGYVCSPSAITFDDSNAEFIVWKYFAGQCTFCGRCAQYCPTHAISLQGKPLGAARDQSTHRLADNVMYHKCASCGQPIVPLPELTMMYLYNGLVHETTAAAQTLCSRCRQRATATTMKEALLGETKR
jgi:hydrogenase-4 component H